MKSIFGICLHRNLSFPQSVKPQRFPHATRSCVDCGAKFEYSWRTMKTGRQIDTQREPQNRLLQFEV